MQHRSAFLEARPARKIWAGDIDNRVKTLVDALQAPDQNEGYDLVTPAADERPFFCLLEEDKLISRISVDTDMLLDPVPDCEQR